MGADDSGLIVDGPRQTLVAFRGFPGARPLYYRQNGTDLVFGSSVEDVSDSSPRLSRRAFALNAAFMIGDLDLTLIQDVKRVLPGQTLVWTNEDREPRVLNWGPRPVFDFAAEDWDITDLANRLRETVSAGIEHGAGPGTGVELSGGLDSTMVAALLSRTSGDGVRSYTWLPPGRTFETWSEAPTVQTIVELCGLDQHLIAKDPGLPRTVRPFLPYVFGPAMENRLAALRVAADSGVDRLMSGWGGDQAASFSGAGTSAHLVKRGNLREALPYIKARGARFEAKRLAAALVAEQRDRRAWLALRRMLHPEFAALLPANYTRFHTRADPDVNRSVHWRDGLLLRRIEGEALLARSLGMTYDYPLLQREVVEWCLQVPARLWSSPKHNRLIFREAMRGLVPDEIRLRKTNGHTAHPVPGARPSRTTLLRELVAVPRVREFAPGLDPEAVMQLEPRYQTMLYCTLDYLAYDAADIPWGD